MYKAIALPALTLLLTSVLGTPTAQDGPLIITTHAQDPGLNYTGFTNGVPVFDDGQPNNPPPDCPSCPGCPDCGPDGQPPLNICGDSTFEDHTSDASPLASDCLVIVKNIQKGGKWEVESVNHSQHQLVQWGTCAFGVQATDWVDGYYYIGNLDIIDIITDSVNKYAAGHGGKVGSAGDMTCGGSLGAHGTHHQVRWGIY